MVAACDALTIQICDTAILNSPILVGLGTLDKLPVLLGNPISIDLAAIEGVPEAYAWHCIGYEQCPIMPCIAWPAQGASGATSACPPRPGGSVPQWMVQAYENGG